MSDEYIHVTGQDGESYEILPTDALLNFLQRMAEDETEEQHTDQYEHSLVNVEAIDY